MPRITRIKDLERLPDADRIVQIPMRVADVEVLRLLVNDTLEGPDTAASITPMSASTVLC